MFETVYFSLGVLNSLFLIAIFVIRKTDIDLVKKIGKLYIISTAIPAICEILTAVYLKVAVEYIIFLSIFLAYLLLEVIYDYILQLHFRNNWKLLVPYLSLYYMMNYGFVVMVWKTSLLKGILLLGLFIVQIISNIITHPRENPQRRK